MESQKICEICKSDASKYVCPRCGVPYCSLKCYKDESKHIKCSESFYRECVLDEMSQGNNAKANDPKEMSAALQRVHDQFADEDDDFYEDDKVQLAIDSDDDEPLEQRLAGISLDDAEKVWDNLTDEERAEFKQFASSVQPEEIVFPWSPWWKEKPELISEIDQQSERSRKVTSSQPDIMENIPLMNTLTKVKPNDHVKRGLMNVIASYVWTAQLYNGELLSFGENPIEPASAFITLSSFLSKDSVFGNCEHALADVSFNACQIPELFDGGPTLQANLSQDVYAILSEPSKSFALSALSECCRLLAKVKLRQSEGPVTDNSKVSSFSQAFNPKNVSNSIPLDPTLLRKARRKVRYLLSFANEHKVL